jgi:threonine aldolase
MCNFVATKVLTHPADAILAEGLSHMIRAESGGVALSSGVLVEPIPTERGIFTPDDMAAALDRLNTAPPPYGPRPSLVTVEQTHNFAGGTIWPLETLRQVRRAAHAHDMPVHMDGARLLNACVATGVSAADYAAAVDTLWLDFTKGLGAPIGAVLAGSRDFIAQARRHKHIFGGAMRQAGIAAAGCLHALDHHVDRLAEDHAHAQRLARGLMGIEGIAVRTPRPETNMVYFGVDGLGLSTAAFLERLARHNVRMSLVRGEVRAVTHLDVSTADIDTALDAVRAIAREAR